METLNIERILAKLKNERHRLDQAISALEKVRAAEAGGQGKRTAKSKQRSKAKTGADGRRDGTSTQKDNREEEASVIAFTPVTRRVS